MPDYRLGKLYRLVCNGHFYIGSSCVPLEIRYSEHKRHAKRHPNLYRYKHFNEVGWDNVKIELILDCPCDNRLQLREFEDIEIRKYKDNPGCVNDIYAVRDKEERKAYNREYGKKHYEINKDKILEKQKEYYNTIKDTLKEKHKCNICGGRYTLSNKLKHERTKKHLEKKDNGRP